jgi:hypothetical protein
MAYREIAASPTVELIEEDYKRSYAYKVCNFLATNYPEEFRRNFASMEECVAQASQAADLWFDKWKVNFPQGIFAAIKGGAAVKT